MNVFINQVTLGEIIFMGIALYTCINIAIK